MQESIKILDEYVKQIKEGKDVQIPLHESDIADIFSELKRNDDKRLFEYINLLPTDIVGNAILELPEK